MNNKSGTIKLNLFESLCGITLLPTCGVVFVTFILVLFLIRGSAQKDFVILGYAYLGCILCYLISLALCLIIVRFSKQELLLKEERFVLKQNEYRYEDILSAKYHKSKWHTVFLFYFSQGGLVEIKLKNGKPLCFKVTYRDFLKLKEKIRYIDIV